MPERKRFFFVDPFPKGNKHGHSSFLQFKSNPTWTRACVVTFWKALVTSPRTTFWTTTDTQTPLQNARLTKWSRNMIFIYKDIDRNTEILKYSTCRIYAAKTHSAISSPTSAPSVTCLLSAAPQNSKRVFCPKADAVLGHFDFMLILKPISAAAAA